MGGGGRGLADPFPWILWIALLEGPKASQGMEVVNDNWLDRVVLSIIYMLTDAQNPFLGTPLVPLKSTLHDARRRYIIRDASV